MNTEQERMLQYAANAVRNALEGDASGHDWHHIERVLALANGIAAEEQGANPFIVGMAALLHDIADYKFHDGDETAGSRAARSHMRRWDMNDGDIERICAIIDEISFKGAGVDTTPSTIEGKIVQDADRLDALGAVGIYRTIAYGAVKGRPMYDPVIAPVLHATSDAHKNARGTTINHFHEKLFLLKERMNTAAGRRIAEQRERFMRLFVEQFVKEWNGEA